MNPSSNYTNNEIITGIRNRARQNKIITDSDEHVNNNINRVVENKTQLPNSNDFQYLVDSREQNKINNQPQTVNSPNNVKDNSKELQENKISFIKHIDLTQNLFLNVKYDKLKILHSVKYISFDIIYQIYIITCIKFCADFTCCIPV